jgi:hypothetical protein
MNSAIKNCITCEGKVSTNAAVCPHCGEPNPTVETKTQVMDEQDSYKSIKKTHVKKKSNSILVNGIAFYYSSIFTLFILICISYHFNYEFRPFFEDKDVVIPGMTLRFIHFHQWFDNLKPYTFIYIGLFPIAYLVVQKQFKNDIRIYYRFLIFSILLNTPILLLFVLSMVVEGQVMPSFLPLVGLTLTLLLFPVYGLLKLKK